MRMPGAELSARGRATPLMKTKRPFIIILMGALLLVILSHIPSLIHDFTKSSLLNLMSVIIFQWAIAFLSLIYYYYFGLLGYRLAGKRRKNKKLWAVICGLTGVWGWLFLRFKKS